MFAVAASGAFSRKSRKVLRPSAICNRHEAAAAEIARRRVDHGQRIAHRDRRIHRIAARLQHIHADMRRQMLRRDHHAVLGGHRRLRGGLRVELAECEPCSDQEFCRSDRGFIVRDPC